MTRKIPIQEMVKLVGSLRLHGRDNGGPVVSSKREMVMDKKIYVAVTGRDLESKSSLVWAIQNTGGKEFCIVYVHQPVHISVPGEMLNEQKLRLYRKEKERAYKKLDKYLNICRQMQVNAEKVYIEMDSVQEGILQLISQRGVKKLVMGAAADKHYTMRMRDLQSKKAIYIRREAPATCHIWFTCNGYLICTREAIRRDQLYLEGTSSSLNQSDATKGTEIVPSSSMAKDDVRIQVALVEAANSKRETQLEASKREEAEKSVIDAIKRAKQSENGYLNELKRRKETEKALKETKEELEKMRSEFETRISESNMVIRNLQGKYSLSMEVLKRLREEQEELKRELSKVSKLKSKCKEEETSPSSNDREPPQYFICPITQEVMEDPYVAADGFTYEGEAISGWFERGHETSPMTNKRLPHTSLVPNLALRSAIQEWLQASSSCMNH